MGNFQRRIAYDLAGTFVTSAVAEYADARLSACPDGNIDLTNLGAIASSVQSNQRFKHSRSAYVRTGLPS
jgi:hypothetical protein